MITNQPQWQRTQDSSSTQQDKLMLPLWYMLMRSFLLLWGIIAIIYCCIGTGSLLYILLGTTSTIQHASLSFGLLVAAGILGIVDLFFWFRPSRFYSLSTSALLFAARAQTAAARHPENAASTSNILNPCNPSPYSNFSNANTTIPIPPTSVGERQAQMQAQRAGSQTAESVQPDSTYIPQSENQHSTSRDTVPSTKTGASLDSSTDVVEPNIRSQTALISPQKFRSFILPREGTDLDHCADKLAFNPDAARYVVTDGVGTSFLPSSWAQIIADHFVNRECDYENEAMFTFWLGECSHEWHKWVQNDWLPLARKNSGQEDWSREIGRGAATTLVGCSFSREALLQHGTTPISVTVVGDAEFFLLSPSEDAAGRWICKDYYRLQYEDFGHTTETLASPDRRVERDFKRVHVKRDVQAKLGDCIILATDALAQWLLLQMQQGKDPWQEVLSIFHHDAFRDFVYSSRSTGEMEIDDTTIMIVPLHPASFK
jgi:hypothetical protein